MIVGLNLAICQNLFSLILQSQVACTIFLIFTFLFLSKLKTKTNIFENLLIFLKLKTENKYACNLTFLSKIFSK